jgi:N-acetylglucosamine-6-sulfatase
VRVARRRRQLSVRLLQATLATATVALALSSPALAGEAEELPQPNIVVVMTDDQTLSSFTAETMPRTFDSIVEAGTSFENFAVTTPLCCPSRAGFYTGQYGHNSEVLANNPGYAQLEDRRNVLPVWLRGAGYRTAFVGKFMHGYEDVVADPVQPAPGFREWYGLQIPNRYYRYDYSENGERKHRGRDPEDYLTSFINRKAVKLVETYAPARKPLFLNVAHLAPHSAKAPSSACHRSAIPAPADEGRYANEPLPLPPSFDEADVSDKPTFIQRLAVLGPEEIVELTRRHRCRLASLREVDRGIKQLVRAFEREDELGRTVFVVTGDNGYFLGEHRLRRGKGLPYEESIRQPLAIRVPGTYLGGLSAAPATAEPVANVDLAPTLLELAGAEPCRPNGDCRTLDGRSLIPLIDGTGPWPSDRGILIEYESPFRGSGRKGEGGSCEYAAIRPPGELYGEHTEIFEPELNRCVPAREVEHYDLDADPYQLDNLFPPFGQALAERQAALAARLDSLRRCSGRPVDQVPGAPPCE